MHSSSVLPYNWQYDEITGNKTRAWIFSALDTTCTTDDMANALSSGKISQQYHDALAANKYGGDTPPKTEYWLELT